MAHFTDILVQKNVISKDELRKIRTEAGGDSRRLDELLIAQGVSEDDILAAKGEVLNVPARRIKEVGRIPFDILKNIPEESARHYQMVPLALKDKVLEVGMVNPENTEAKEALRFIASRIGVDTKIFLITLSDLDAVLKEYKGFGGEAVKVLGELESVLAEQKVEIPEEIFKGIGEGKLVEEAPVTKMVATILRHAVESRASDIHIEPTRDKVKIRFRIDGVLYVSLLLPLGIHDAIVSRIKILTNMLLDEKRRPQDGRFSASIGGRQIDFRVSTFPSSFGEKVVLRILDPEKGIKSLEQLGLYGYNLETIKETLRAPYGMILLTGPTGSGKTTTLYSMLQLLDREKNNVVSLEDPVEYIIEGVSQSQVKPEIGYDFANGLRSILRQDPDIIMVGEIRDKETAKLAVQAALTGHLVLSTLHTNNAIGVIPRLVDMGIDPYLIPPTLKLAVAQRLIPTLCMESRKAMPLTGALKEKIEKELADIPESTRKTIKVPSQVYQPFPSPKCPRGTEGRVAVYEALRITKELEQIILTNPSEPPIFKEARRQGMITMREDGIIKVLEGRVGFEELEGII
jgi:type IV pilus assembly protein PilB